MLRLLFAGGGESIKVQKKSLLPETSFKALVGVIFALYIISLLYFPVEVVGFFTTILPSLSTSVFGFPPAYNVFIIVASVIAGFSLWLKRRIYKTHCVLWLKPDKRLLVVEYMGREHREEIDLRAYSILESVTYGSETELFLKSREVTIILAWLFSMTYQRFIREYEEPATFSSTLAHLLKPEKTHPSLRKNKLIDEVLAEWLNTKLVRDYKQVNNQQNTNTKR